MQTKQEIRRTWDKKNSKSFCIRFYLKNDKDIIEWMEKQENKSGAVRRLILEELRRSS